MTAKRRQTQRTEIRYRQRHLEDRDVTLVKGLPVMTLERTLADLLDDVAELSLVADALGSGVKNRSLDFDRLRELFSPLAERNGFKKQDGNAVLEHLLKIAGLDLDSVARRISVDSALSSRILTNYLEQAVDERLSEALIDAALPDISKAVAEIVNTPVLANISKQWAKEPTALAASTIAHGAARASQESEE